MGTIGVDTYRHNHAVFDDERVTTIYERQTEIGSGFLNGGERAAVVAAAPHGRGAEILDVGVGAGRTTPLMKLISSDYVAVDYSPRMVEAFRRQHPGVQCSVADARDLTDFADRRFGLVLFSNNGIDTVEHADRVRVLAELARVTTDDGVIVFSTLNKYGPSFGESPFQLRRPTTSGLGLRDLVVRLGRQLFEPMGALRAVRNWMRSRKLVQDNETWAMGPLAAHEYAPFVHFTSVRDLRRTISAAGLHAIAIYDERGGEIDPRTDTSTADNFTAVVCRI